MANEYMGWKRYLHFGSESTWATLPGTPTYYQLPYDDYSVRPTPVVRQTMRFNGIRQRKHSKSSRYTLAGNLTCPLYGYTEDSSSFAEKLIAAAFSGPASVDLDSLFAEWFDSVEVKRHLGLRVNTCTIQGSEQQENVTITLGLIGKSETGVSAGSAQAIDETLNIEQTEFLFSDAVFTLNSVATQMASFVVSINNNLQSNFLNSQTVSLLHAGDRIVDFMFALKKNATTYDALRRTPGTNEIVGTTTLALKGVHLGTGATGNYATATAAFDRIGFVDAQESGGRSEHIIVTPAYAVLKPSSSDNDIDWTFGEAA